MPLENELNPESVKSLRDRFERIRPAIRANSELILSVGSLFLVLGLTHQAIKFIVLKHYRFNMIVKPMLVLGFYYGTEPLLMAYRCLTRYCRGESPQLNISFKVSRFVFSLTSQA